MLRSPFRWGVQLLGWRRWHQVIRGIIITEVRMRNWDWPTGVAAVLLALALTLAAVPLTQTTGTAQQAVNEKLAVVEARVNDLSRADLPQRVTRIEAETQQASALLKAILGWLGAMSAASPFAYTGLRKHITRTVTETVPTRKQH